MSPQFGRLANETGNYAGAQLTTITNVVNGGVALSQSFIAGIATNNQGIILVEAAAPTTKPLVLTIYHGTNQIAQTSLYLSISGVEQMFRHKNLLLNASLAAVPSRLTDASVPNEPDTLDKNFVFVHGYGVNPRQARGRFAAMFKRMYWSGSHAKFYGVTWQGSQSQGRVIPGVTCDYHTNAANAMLTAPKLADFLATLTNGPVVTVAHSLGNMVMLSALSDWNAHVDKHFMMDAAVAIEAIQGEVGVEPHMVYSDWVPYTNRLYTSKWFTLFPANDGRSQLTWSNRFSNLPIMNLYNFYSSGEEVLREYDNDPPSDVVNAAATELVQHYWSQIPYGSYVWVWQEKGKGRTLSDTFIGSTHGGWKFNTYYDLDLSGTHMWPSNAALLADSQLQTNAFFAVSSATFNADAALYGSSGSAYAQTNRNRILSDAIPALSLPAGANQVPKLSPVNGDTRNFDMNASYENGWPQIRLLSGEKNNNWYHGDYVAVAYTFTYGLFDQYVKLGNLK